VCGGGGGGGGGGVGKRHDIRDFHLTILKVKHPEINLRDWRWLVMNSNACVWVQVCWCACVRTGICVWM